LISPARPQDQRIGKLRPSQIVTQHGPGAVVDLPELSVIVGGTNYWEPTGIDRVFEPRLEAFCRVHRLYKPPRSAGLPTFIFPEWLVCPKCRLLAPYTEFSFQYGNFVCTRNNPYHGGRRPEVFPARFMIACAAGHLDDFPWHRWVHKGTVACLGPLELHDNGSSGSASDLEVKCVSCGRSRSLGGAFEKDAVSPCTCRRPWLGSHNYEKGCAESVRTLLRGASNAYFSVVSSALSIPPWSDPIQQELTPYRDALLTAKSLDHLRQGIEGGFYDLGDLLERYKVEDLWKALRAEPDMEEDLKSHEYVAFLHPGAVTEVKSEFDISAQPVHERYQARLSQVVAASRLREVRALRAFTRIDSVPDIGERTDVGELNAKLAPLGLKDRDSNWIPAVDLRGEGIFLRLDPAALGQWEENKAVQRKAGRLAQRFADWRASRDMDAAPFPGARYVLLHTLAHVLMRQLSLDCGYSSSALRERIYCRTGEDEMAGLLIYTASSDSEGSLGGLVDMSAPDRLAPVLTNALHESEFCASDPLCGGGGIRAAANMNGAACHACLLLAETSCEFSNRLLDRAVLVETLGQEGTAFFEDVIR
jgi:hypothetical protein